MKGKKKQSKKKKRGCGVAGSNKQQQQPAAGGESSSATGGDATPTDELGLVASCGAPLATPWVKVIVRRGRVNTQEWVPAKILKEDKANDLVEVEAQGKTLQLKTGQVHMGATKPTDTTTTVEDANKLRREVADARGNLVTSPVFRGPLPYENAVGMGWLQRDIETTREQLLLGTARENGIVMLSAVTHYVSYIGLLEHDILHVAADIERRATVVKSLQRSCRDARRAEKLQRKHDTMVAQSQGYNVNVEALKAEAIGFRSCNITKKASTHVNHTWKRYGSSKQFMRKADVEETEEASFESLLSQMKLEDESSGGADHAGDAGTGLGHAGGGDQHLSDTFISFGTSQWWWLSAEERATPKRGWSSGGDTPDVIFEEAVLHEMATLSNAKLAGCPSTLLPTERYSCRCCSRRDAICKVMIMTEELQTDHPFCYACLEKADQMLSKYMTGNPQYVPLDTVNYGSVGQAHPDRQPMSVAEARTRFRATTTKELQENPAGAVESATAVGLGGKPWGEGDESQAGEKVLQQQLTSSNLLVTPNDQAELDRLDRQCRSLVESPLSSDQIDWFEGTVAEEDRQEVRRVAREQMAHMRRSSVLRFESQAVREGWTTAGRGIRSSVKPSSEKDVWDTALASLKLS